MLETDHDDDDDKQGSIVRQKTNSKIIISPEFSRPCWVHGKRNQATKDQHHHPNHHRQCLLRPTSLLLFIIDRENGMQTAKQKIFLFGE
jgi:hypothetical protein